MQTIEFSEQVAQSGLTKLRASAGANAPYSVLTGEELLSAQLLILAGADYLLADVGAVPLLVDERGGFSLQACGVGRYCFEKIPDDKREAVSTAYLAVCNVLRRSMVGAESTYDAYRPVGMWPVVVVRTLGLLGIAATIAGAWYAKAAKEADVKLGAQYTKDLLAADALVKAMRDEIARSGKVSSDTWKAFSGFAEAEKKAESPPWYLPIPIVLALAAITAGLVDFVRKGERKRASA